METKHTISQAYIHTHALTHALRNVQDAHVCLGFCLHIHGNNSVVHNPNTARIPGFCIFLFWVWFILFCYPQSSEITFSPCATYKMSIQVCITPPPRGSP